MSSRMYTRLEDFSRLPGVRIKSRCMSLVIQRDWIIPTEDRLAYTTLLRLCEALRDLHWKKDVIPNAKGLEIDSVVVALTSEFSRPVRIGDKIRLTYIIREVRRTSYSVTMLARHHGAKSPSATCSLTSVFIDPNTFRPIAPPPSVILALKQQISKTSAL